MISKPKIADKPTKANTIFIPHRTIPSDLPKSDGIEESTGYQDSENELILKEAIAAIKGKKLFEKQNEEADRQLDRSTFKISTKYK